jgi:hypothetical protein
MHLNNRAAFLCQIEYLSTRTITPHLLLLIFPFLVSSQVVVYSATVICLARLSKIPTGAYSPEPEGMGKDGRLAQRKRWASMLQVHWQWRCQRNGVLGEEHRSLNGLIELLIVESREGRRQEHDSVAQVGCRGCAKRRWMLPVMVIVT